MPIIFKPTKASTPPSATEKVETSTTSASHFLVLTTAASLLIVGWGAAVWAWRKQQTFSFDDDDSENDNGNDQNSDDDESMLIWRNGEYQKIPMGWDGAKDAKNDNDDDDAMDRDYDFVMDGDDDNNPVSSILHHDAAMDQLHQDRQEKKELEFLATMTFANGGMRAPTCPCCE